MNHKTEKVAMSVAALAIVIFAAQLCGAFVSHALIVRDAPPPVAATTPMVPMSAVAADPWPECRAACHSDAAWLAVQNAARIAGAGFACFAEDNDQMPEGYEVLCMRQ